MHERSGNVNMGVRRVGYSPGGNSRERRTSPLLDPRSCIPRTPRRDLAGMATRGKTSEKKSKSKRGKEKQESLKSPLPLTEDSHDSMSSTSTGGEPAPKPSKKKRFSLSKKPKKSHSSSSQSSMKADGSRSSPELHSPLTDATSSHTHAESSFGPEELPSQRLEEEEEEEVFRDGQQAMKVELVHAVYLH